jgi:3',5'-cyclic AMP phosphodiesterase CpdA
MESRRHFFKLGIAIAAGTVVTSVLGNEVRGTVNEKEQDDDCKLRFLLASDGHYGEPKTDFERTHDDIIKWINQEHATKKIDFTIFNGDLVHDRPELLKVVKDNYFSKLKMPYYALPGNHDHATSAIWNEVFGYDVNYSIDKGDIAFVLANTADQKGAYVCPDINFLKNEFEKYRSKAIVFVVLHIPPYQWLKEETYFTDCADVVELMHSFPNIKAVFHGHDHSLDVVRYTNKLPHFFDGHYGGSWGTLYHGYRVVEIGHDNKVTTFQVNPGLNPLINKTSV